MQYLHVLPVQRSLARLRPSQAFHDIVCKCRIMLAIFPIILAYRTRHCTEEAGSRRGIIDTRRRHQWFVSLRDFHCKGIHTYVGVDLYRSKYMLRQEITSFFFSAQAWRPSTCEGAHSSFVPLTTAAVAVTTSTQPSPIQPPSSIIRALYGRPSIKQGGGRLPTVPCVRFNTCLLYTSPSPRDS